MAYTIWQFHEAAVVFHPAFENPLLDGNQENIHASGFTLHHGSSGDSIVFTGTFTVDALGFISGGTITGFDVVNSGTLAARVSGYAIDYIAFSAALQTLRTGDSEPLFSLLFANPMNVVGSPGDDVPIAGWSDDEVFGSTGDDHLDAGSGHDFISGGPDNDDISGGPGHDTLSGGTGRDLLAGGSGRDAFVFVDKLAKANADIVDDFSAAFDVIVLEAGIVPKVNDEGFLKGKFFADGKADDRNDFIVYKEKNGKVLYDRDGDGNAKGKLIATLKGSPDLDASDFFMV